MKNYKKIMALVLSIGLVAGCSSQSVQTETPTSTGSEAKYDVEDSADVIIVGGGGTGMSAALTAVENGAEKVIIVEN